MAKYSLLAGDTNEVSIVFSSFLHKLQMSKKNRFILSLAYGRNVNYDQSLYHPLSTPHVRIGDATATFKTDK